MTTNDFAGEATSISYRTLEPNSYNMTLAHVILTGVQKGGEYKGTPKPDMKNIILGFEVDDEKEEDGSPVVIYNYQMPLFHISKDKAKINVNFLYKLDPHGKSKGDISKLIGTKCLGTVLQKQTAKGRTYNTVASVTSLPEKQKTLVEDVPEDRTTIFSPYNPDMEVWAKIPKFIQIQIKGALDYKSTKLYAILGDEPEETKKSKEAAHTSYDTEEVVEDEIPYDL